MKFLQLALLMLGFAAAAATPSSASDSTTLMFQLNFMTQGASLGPEMAEKYAGKSVDDAITMMLKEHQPGISMCIATKNAIGEHFLIGFAGAEHPLWYVYVDPDDVAVVKQIATPDDAASAATAAGTGMMYAIQTLVPGALLETSVSADELVAGLSPTRQYLEAFVASQQ